MEQRDFIMRQIMMLTLFIKKLISRLLELNEKDDSLGMVEAVKTSFKDELQLDLDEMLLLPDEKFVQILKEKYFGETHLEALAMMFEMVGRPDLGSFSLVKDLFLRKSLAIYLHLEAESKSYSVDRNEKIVRIKEMLDMN